MRKRTATTPPPPPAALPEASLLLLEDEPLLRKRLAAFLTREGATVQAVSTVGAARQALAATDFDLALCDVNLPDGEGLDLLREGALGPATTTVIMTSEGGVARAVEAMRLGAADFLAKPFEFEELPLVFARARAAQKGQRRAERAQDDDSQAAAELFFGEGLDGLRGQLEKILAADRRLTQGTPPPVLLEGETGTGKTTFAKWLHHEGPRAEAAFLHVNCAALPETLAESELFGHERGAFTDAKAARLGLFEAASGGTLFLDEVASLSPAIQAKLLTVLESRSVRRVGGQRAIAVDVRLLCASNVPLKEAVAQGRFRADLYHRLDLLRVALPPLRQRPRDIPALARHLLAGLARRYGLPPPTMSPLGERRLARYPWPGNIRELTHELERALVLGDGAALDFPHLEATALGPLAETTPTATGAVGALQAAAAAPDDWLAPGWRLPPEGGFRLEAAINRWVQLALDQSKGNVSAAARLLGVSRDYIRYRLAMQEDGEAK